MMLCRQGENMVLGDGRFYLQQNRLLHLYLERRFLVEYCSQPPSLRLCSTSVPLDAVAAQRSRMVRFQGGGCERFVSTLQLGAKLNRGYICVAIRRLGLLRMLQHG